MIKRNNELQIIAVKLSFIRLVKRLIGFENGLEWIIQWKIWQFFLNFTDFRNHTQITLREQASLIVDLLIKLEEQKQYDLCHTIVETMIQPLNKKEWFDSSKYVASIYKATGILISVLWPL